MGTEREERRSDKRAVLSGVKATYEDAGGTRIEEDVLDLSAGGLFIRSKSPMAVGKRIALDLSIIGEAGPFSALGRVVWTRPEATPGRPAGMGVKLIDVDDATLEVIERLVGTREPTAPGVGESPSVRPAPVVAAAPERERTLMGVGLAPEPAPPAEAKVAPKDEPRIEEKVVIEPEPAGPPKAVAVVESQSDPSLVPHPEREQSVAIDLVSAKKDVPAAPPAPAPPKRASQPSVPSEKDQAGGTARWIVILLLLVIAGIAAYVLFTGFLRPMGR